MTPLASCSTCHPLASSVTGFFNTLRYWCVQMLRCGNFGQPGGLQKSYLFVCQDIAIKYTCQVLWKNIQPGRSVTKFNTRYLTITQMFTAFVIYLFSCQVVQFWRQTLPMTCLGRVRKLPDFQFGTSKVIRLRRVSLGFRATFHRHSRLESCPNIRTGIWCRIFQCQNKKLQSSTERHIWREILPF